MKREPRTENENLYRDRMTRKRSSRVSSEDRQYMQERAERFRGSEARYRQRNYEEDWRYPQEGQERISPSKKEKSYREEKEYYYRSLKERSYRREPEYRGPEYREPDYRGQEYREPEYRRPEYRGSEYREPEYRVPEYREPEYREPARRKRKKNGGLLAFVIFLILVFAVVLIWVNPTWKKAAIRGVLSSPVGALVGEIAIGGNYKKTVLDKDFHRSAIRMNAGAAIPKGNRTIALFGIDARAEEIRNGARSDTILVINIDSEGRMKMASILRDTYLMSRNSNGEEIISKANSAFFRGGPEAAINMLNENFDLAITDYVVLNFWGMTNIVDLMGGIRLTVSEEERLELNSYIHDMHVYVGMSERPLEASGTDILINGDQATNFCRIRMVPFHSPIDGVTYHNDYGRTARQRYVMMSLISQMRERGLFGMMSLANKLFAANDGEERFIQSSLGVGELMKWFGQGFDLNVAGNESFPNADHLYTAMLDSGDTVVADTLEENAVLLHEFLYGDSGYAPSSDLTALADRIRAEVDRQR